MTKAAEDRVAAMATVNKSNDERAAPTLPLSHPIDKHNTVSHQSARSASSSSSSSGGGGGASRPQGSGGEDGNAAEQAPVYPSDTTAAAAPAMVKEKTRSPAESRGAMPRDVMHVSIPLGASVYDPPSRSPESQPASAGRLAALDGLGISHFLDAFPPPEEEAGGSELYDLSHYPLPIRLGLMRPGQLPRSARKRLHRPHQSFPEIDPPVQAYKRRTTPQYCHGYYLCTAPPAGKEEKSMTSPDFPLVRRDSFHRHQFSRARSYSDAAGGEERETRRRASIRGHSSELPKRWKLEQYFRSYSRKTCNGTKSYKFHAYDWQEACYWWGYSVRTLVAEQLNHCIINTTAGLSVLDWSKGAPRRVLDIGTGAGAWVVDSAKVWPQTEFIGLDLVPIQTPLSHLPDEDLQSRISWVVANALQGLPFPDDSFDYVHIRKLNIGVPEEKWGILLSEAVRVLTPNGNLEILETDWTFMGSPKEILTSDLQELVASRGRANNAKMKMWKRKDSRKYEFLGMAVNQMLRRRKVKFDPASIIPFHLMNLDVNNLSQGQPRHFPILARSSACQAFIEEEAKDKIKTKPWSPQGPSTAASFTMRPQIGLPLPPHRFQIDNQDMFRMALLVGDVTRISEARDMIWDDLQRDEKQEQDLGEEEPVGIGPWKHKGEFEEEMDEWFEDLTSRADLENLLNATFDWNKAASRMDARIHLDREFRKEKKREAGLVNGHELASPESLSPISTVIPLGGTSPHKGSPRRFSHAASDSCEDEEDQSTIQEHTHDDSVPFSLTTPILAFRTTTAFAAKKRAL